MRDVFNSFLLKNADYTSDYELPILRGTTEIPGKLVLFSEAIKQGGDSSNAWTCFYEFDEKFQRIWLNPNKYLRKLLQRPGTLSPDFSMYRNMPHPIQLESCFKNRAIAHWLEEQGLPVIPNVRWADERSFRYCFDGIPPHTTIAVGSHGCLRYKEDRFWFRFGLEELVSRLSPSTLVVYGAAPVDIFEPALEQGIPIVTFESKFSQTHRKAR